MSKYLFFLLLLIISFQMSAQYVPGQYTQFSPQDTANHNKNVLYLSTVMAPVMFGIRYDRNFEYTGCYVGLNVGKVPGGSFYRNRMYRIGAGCIIQLEYLVDQIDSPILTFGGAYQHWQSQDYDPNFLNPEYFFRQFVFDFGFGGRIKRFNVAGRVDFTTPNFLFDVGFNF